MKKILFLVTIVFILVGCSCSKFISDSKKYNEMASKYEKIAIEEAKKYIQNKYGFTLLDNEIEGASALSSGSYGMAIEAGTPSGEVIVNAHHNNIQFKIHINANLKEYEKYYDNYEKNIILNDLNNYFVEKLDSDKSKVRIFTDENMFYGIQSHDKYIDLVNFISKIELEKNSNILVLIYDDLDETKINNIYKELNLKELTIVKISQGEIIDSYKLKNDSIPNHLTNNSNIFDNGSLFIEQRCSCQSGYCLLSKYNIVSLENNNYLKYSDSNIKVSKIDGSEYNDKVQTCNKGTISSVYKISYNYDRLFPSYDLFVVNSNKIVTIKDNTVNCNPLIINEKDGKYIVLNKLIESGTSDIIVFTN